MKIKNYNDVLNILASKGYCVVAFEGTFYYILGYQYFVDLMVSIFCGSYGISILWILWY
jgi:hypothetical protein